MILVHSQSLIVGTGNTTTLCGNYTYDSVFVNSGGIIVINSSCGYINISASLNITIYGTINGLGKSGGTVGSVGGGGVNCANPGASGGTGSSLSGNLGGTGGGGGGFCFFCGGSAAGGSQGITGNILGSINGRYEIGTNWTGSPGGGGGGGGGGCSTTCNPGGNGASGGTGGEGGGSVKLTAPIIIINGTITVSGSNGGNGGKGGDEANPSRAGSGGGGGAGGSAGQIIIDGGVVNINNASLFANGSMGGIGGAPGTGSGGSTGSNGQAGAGGRIKIFYNTLYNETLTFILGGTIYYELTNDTTPPAISIIFPLNNSNHSNSNLNINYTTSDMNLSSCWYSNDSMSVNVSLANCSTNITGITWAEGSHNVTIWANDTVGNIGSNSISFTIDTIPPSIKIIYPGNNSNFTSGNVDINYTASDIFLSSCWYSNDSMSVNVSLANCSTNITGITWAEGSHNVIVWANDSAGNVNSSSVTFLIDLTAPTTLTYPVLSNGSIYSWGNWTDKDVTIYLISIDYGVGVNNLEFPKYCIDTTNSCSPNVSIGSSGGSVLISSDGINYLRFYSNDSLGNNETIQSKIIKLAKNYPSISIIYPLNNSNHSNSNLNINYTVSSSVGIDSCWYSNDSMSVNVSLANCSTNITGITWAEGSHNVIVWANDSAGNVNSSSVTFLIDFTAPTIYIAEPKVQNYGNNNSISLNYTVNDLGIGVKSCWYYVTNTTSVIISTTILSSCQNTTFSLPGPDDDYTLYLFSQDYLLNYGYTSVSFGIRTSIPVINLFPQNDSYKNYLNDNIFGFIVTNTTTISSCELWTDSTGIFSLNQTLFSVYTTTTNYFSPINLTEGVKNWNVKCTSGSNIGWANNQTYIIDITNPEVKDLATSTTKNLQTFNFTVYVNDTNLNNCKYTILTMNGVVDGLNNNVTFNCSGNIYATATLFGKFNLSIYSYDKAGNYNQTSKLFTLETSAGSPGGGGGGTIIEETIPVLALIKPENVTGYYDNLKRAILYKIIYEFCINNTKNGKCLKTKSDQLSNNLNSIYSINTNEDEVELWIDQYDNNKIESVAVLKSDADKWKLKISTITISEEKFSISPSNIDNFKFVFSGIQIRERIESNKILSSCKVESGDYGFFCEVSNSTFAYIIYNISDVDSPAKTVSARISYVNSKGEGIFQSVQFRIINWLGMIIITIFISIIFILLLLRREIKNQILSLLNIFKGKNRKK